MLKIQNTEHRNILNIIFAVFNKAKTKYKIIKEFQQ